MAWMAWAQMQPGLALLTEFARAELVLVQSGTELVQSDSERRRPVQQQGCR
jgi:hypothetical protein